MPVIEIGDKRISYKFEINGKYSLIKGNSGTGKTTLYNLIYQYQKGIRGIINNSSHVVMTLPVKYKQMNTSVFKNAVVFIDSEDPILREKGFEHWLKGIDAYFVFMSRGICLNKLPISANSVYIMRTSNGIHYLECTGAQGVRRRCGQEQPQMCKISYGCYMQQAKKYSGVTPSNARARVLQVNYKEQYCVLTKAGVRRQFQIRKVVSAVMNGTLVLSNPSALREWRGFIKD